MSISLTTINCRPAVEIEDHKGELWRYTYRLARPGPTCWLCTLTCLDPQTGEPAESRDGRVREYLVRESGGQWSCECPDWQYHRRKAGEPCKHISEARELRALLEVLTGVAS